MEASVLSVQTQQRENMGKQLWNAYQQALSTAGTQWWGGAGALSGLQALQPGITSLVTTKKADVLRGTLTHERWVAMAREYGTGINSIAKESLTWGDFWTAVVVKSAKDTATGVAEVAKPIAEASHLYIAAGLAALLLILAIKVT